MNKEENLKQVILDALNEIACDDIGACQLNFQSESARQMISAKIEPAIQNFINHRVTDAVEQVVCWQGDSHG